MSQAIDNEMEKDIQRLGLVAPRITPEHIQELMERVVFDVHVIPGSTTTLATALLDGFSLATEKTACADPANFNRELGEKYAIEAAREAASNKLWELEGYVLKKFLSIERSPLARLCQEQTELAIRQNKLGAFLFTDKFEDLSQESKDLLTEQNDLTVKLLSVLEKRIALF